MSDRPAELARDLRDTWLAVESAMTARLDLGLRPAHLPLLRVVNRGPARMSDIAREVGVSRQAVAQTAAPLVEAGLLEVSADPADARAKLLRYTDWGRERYAESLAIYEAIEALYAERAGEKGVASLREQLAELRAAARAFATSG